jgi:thiamine pyrophosphokinase
MKPALIFLNGNYDSRYPEFYRREIEWGFENKYPLISADAGLQFFHNVNQTYGTQFAPTVLIGDLDSLDEFQIASSIEQFQASGTQVVREWIGQVNKDYTDGQLAVAYAIEEFSCGEIIIYGGLPQSNGYETDHFLGNLKLMRFGFGVFSNKMVKAISSTRSLSLANQGGRIDDTLSVSRYAYRAEMRDVFQTIHFVVSDLTLERKNEGLQRVSLVAAHHHVIVASSENLRWDLARLRVDPDMDANVPNTLRNEFTADADNATIRLEITSDPVYVIHNWYSK